MQTSNLNYLATYEWSLNNRVKQDRADASCFSSLYYESKNLVNDPVNSGIVSIKVYFSKEMNLDMIDNYCLLNESELAEYIEWIKKTTKFNIKISKGADIKNNYDNTDYKILTVKFTKKMPYEIRLICALIRNLYECPFNIMVKTAFLMGNLDEFKHLDFTERLSISINSIIGYREVHSVIESSGTNFYDNKSIRKRYLKISKVGMNVSNFMIRENKIGLNRYNFIDQIDPDTEENIFDSLEEDYISEDFKQILISNYKIMKENER